MSDANVPQVPRVRGGQHRPDGHPHPHPGPAVTCVTSDLPPRVPVTSARCSIRDGAQVTLAGPGDQIPPNDVHLLVMAQLRI